MATNPRSDEDVVTQDGTAQRDDLRVRRTADPAVIPAPQEPMNAPARVPEVDHETAVYERQGRWADVRGGLSLAAGITGALVAMGAMVIFLAITAGALIAAGVINKNATAQTSSIVRATILTGVGLVVAQFIAYLWGGYTAGRMARGAGAANGFLVPLLAILIAAGVGALVRWLGTTAHLNYAFQTTRLPIDRDLKIHLGMGIGIASVLAMFVGGIAGGVRGAWWHRKLERSAMQATDRDVEP
ncbi:MAG TPA: hypothetical protein VJ818_02075 [Actinomycetota bacterium]|nr:hypothetical protein [Actinomycetota bacterium]